MMVKWRKCCETLRCMELATVGLVYSVRLDGATSIVCASLCERHGQEYLADTRVDYQLTLEGGEVQP